MDTIKTGQFKNLSTLSKKKILLSAAALAIVIAGIVLGLVLTGPNKGTLANVCTQKPNLALLNNAAIAITKSDSVTLSQYAKRIEHLSGYNNDPNCMYVLFETALSSSNLKEAKTYLNTLSKIFPEHGFYGAFGNPTYKSLQEQLNNETTAVAHTGSDFTTIRNPK